MSKTIENISDDFKIAMPDVEKVEVIDAKGKNILSEDVASRVSIDYVAKTMKIFIN